MPTRKKTHESAHGRHRTDSVPFSMWLPLEKGARLRHLVRHGGVPAAQLVLRTLNPLLDTVRLDAADRAWIAERRKRNAHRSY